MPNGVILQGTSGYQADVDANNQVKTTLTKSANLAGIAGIGSRTDAGQFTGSTIIREMASMRAL